MIQVTSDIKVLVIIGMAFMLLIFASILVIFISSQKKKAQHLRTLQHLRESQQNQLIEAAVRSEESERHRIAEELHDEVGAILSSTKLHFQGIKEGSMDERDRQLYDKGKELLDEGIRKVRSISHNLHSNILKEFGLNDAIQHFVNTITRGTLVKVNTELDASYTTQNTEAEMSIYRLFQELVNNILKHSSATEIHVTTKFTGSALQLSLFHNGRGITQQEFEELRYGKEGLGLKNIQNRIILLRGQILFTSGPDGYQIIIDVPINRAT